MRSRCSSCFGTGNHWNERERELANDLGVGSGCGYAVCAALSEFAEFRVCLRVDGTYAIGDGTRALPARARYSVERRAPSAASLNGDVSQFTEEHRHPWLLLPWLRRCLRDDWGRWRLDDDGSCAGGGEAVFVGGDVIYRSVAVLLVSV